MVCCVVQLPLAIIAPLKAAALKAGDAPVVGPHAAAWVPFATACRRGHRGHRC